LLPTLSLSLSLSISLLCTIISRPNCGSLPYHGFFYDAMLPRPAAGFGQSVIIKLFDISFFTQKTENSRYVCVRVPCWFGHFCSGGHGWILSSDIALHRGFPQTSRLRAMMKQTRHDMTLFYSEFWLPSEVTHLLYTRLTVPTPQ
jgi:hypothetical protein